MSDAAPPVDRVELVIDGDTLHIEHAWIAPERREAPLLVFLHEGLGSRSAWRDFPRHLCDTAGCRGLVYSRPGHGRSTPRAERERRALDYMHLQAHVLLPHLLDALGVDTRVDPPWLLGHSDGASIALLHAARFPRRVAGLIVMAPHIFVEDLSLTSIARARDAYPGSELRAKLARHHDDHDFVFWGWNDAWLDPAFRAWSIEDEIRTVTCPVLAIQGLDDEYGTLAQVHGIARRLPQTLMLELPGCGHAPHRDQPQRVIAAATEFIHQHEGDKR